MARRRRRTSEHAEAHADERWLITYADMITLLMAFFIMLFAMSQIDLEKFRQFQDAIAREFNSPARAVSSGDGILSGAKSPAGEGASPTELPGRKQERVLNELERERRDLLEAKVRIEKGLAAKGLSNRVRFEINERGLVVAIVSDEVLFDLGSAALRDDGAEVLDVVARMIKPLPNRIAVEGHTDNRPISSAVYPSNWELSTGRASTVVRYLTSRHGFQPSRLSAAGYADQHPAATNSTEAGRQRNRRVEIVVISRVTERAS